MSPVFRSVEINADTVPSRSGGAAPSMALWFGVLNNEVPVPNRAKYATTSPTHESLDSVEIRANPVAAQASPTGVSTRGPTRSDRRRQRRQHRLHRGVS